MKLSKGKERMKKAERKNTPELTNFDERQSTRPTCTTKDEFKGIQT